jgi:ABC-type branched-subunit amino acid transport system ATPase component
MGYKYSFWRFLADARDANDRAEEVLDMIKLHKRRDVLAMNLTYAEQRALEIGITIAGGASVILLDEPTAGMSRSETARFVNLIREVTVGKTLLTVEHDMGVVFGLADKIAVLVYGEVIAFDTPAKVRANERVKRPTWVSAAWLRCAGAATLGHAENAGRSRTSTPSTARAMCCMACTLMCNPVRSWRCWAATARAAAPPSRPSWEWWTGTGSVQLERSSNLRQEGLRDRPCRHRLRAREPRHLSHADRAPEPDAGAEAGRQGRRWSFDDMYQMFPRLKERQHTEAGVLSGGEQQMLTLCRTLMGDPELIMIDEPTEGLAPKIVELVAEYLRELRRRGIAVLLVEQKLTIALQVADRCLVMGHGADRVRGHAGGAARQRLHPQGVAGGLALQPARYSCASSHFSGERQSRERSSSRSKMNSLGRRSKNIRTAVREHAPRTCPPCGRPTSGRRRYRSDSRDRSIRCLRGVASSPSGFRCQSRGRAPDRRSISARACFHRSPARGTCRPRPCGTS